MSLTSFHWHILIQELGVLYPRNGPVWRNSLSKLPLESVRIKQEKIRTNIQSHTKIFNILYA